MDILLIQLSASRDVRIYLQEVQLLSTLLAMDSAEQHTAGLNAHHLARRQVDNGNQGLAQQLFRLIEGMNTAQNSAVSASTIIQGKLQQLFALGHSNTILNLYSTEVRFAEGVEINEISKERFNFHLGEINNLGSSFYSSLLCN